MGLLSAAAAVLWAYSPAYLSAKRKFAEIESDRLPPGSRVVLTREELNAYVREDLARHFPDGVRNLELQPGTGAATGSALVDFNRVRRAQGKPPGWLMARLLEGEHPVKVHALIRSGEGRATVDVDSVEVSGMEISGPVLDYLIQNYLLPNYPAAKIGQPFALGHRIERLDIKPAAVEVRIGAK